jgi:SAM-dependent methyltransferase
MTTDGGEAAAVAERYARRSTLDDRYSFLRPEVWQMAQERQRRMLRMFVRHDLVALGEVRLLEVGCGTGGNLLELLRLGFRADHMIGAELLPDRVAQARLALPSLLPLHVGDATALELPSASQDVVLLSTVFSSLLDDAFQERMAEVIWCWLRPGGAVLWYDFVFDNPRNPDVRGVPLARIRELFPQGSIDARRVTLAPPIARRVCRIHPSLYTVFNALPLLRTHLLCWIEKP